MKKIVAVLGLCAIIAMPAFAQKADKVSKCSEKASAPGECKAGRQLPNPFEGLNLNAEQQSKIDALKKECKENRDAKAKERKQKSGECARKARTEQLAKIKEILTPEQYVKFLENNFINSRPGKKFGDKGMRAHHPRKYKQGKHHARQGRQCPAVQDN